MDLRAIGGKREKPSLLQPKRHKKPTPNQRTSRVQKAHTPLPQGVTFKLVTEEHGFADYDVLGHDIVKRVTVGQNMRKGDVFNAYCHDGGKCGGTWSGNLELSLKSLFNRLGSSIP